MRQQIINLIAAGSTKEHVLSIVDITPAALEELISDKSFSEDVLRAKANVEDDRIDILYADVEKKTLTRIKENLEFCDPLQLTKVLEAVSKNRLARRLPAQQNGYFNNPTIGIQITVPVFLNNDGNSGVIRDSNNHVVAINGRSMAPLPVDRVHKLFNSMAAAEQEIENEDPIEADWAREVAKQQAESTGQNEASREAETA